MTGTRDRTGLARQRGARTLDFVGARWRHALRR
jgi:hypothetical protein